MNFACSKLKFFKPQMGSEVSQLNRLRNKRFPITEIVFFISVNRHRGERAVFHIVAGSGFNAESGGFGIGWNAEFCSIGMFCQERPKVIFVGFPNGSLVCFADFKKGLHFS